jgi:hypothetical protein
MFSHAPQHRCSPRDVHHCAVQSRAVPPLHQKLHWRSCNSFLKAALMCCPFALSSVIAKSRQSGCHRRRRVALIITLSTTSTTTELACYRPCGQHRSFVDLLAGCQAVIRGGHRSRRGERARRERGQSGGAGGPGVHRGGRGGGCRRDHTAP